VLADDTLESLRQRVQTTEPNLYIEAIKSILSGGTKQATLKR